MVRVFPLIDVRKQGENVLLQTDVRVKHKDGQWYLQRHFRTAKVFEENELIFLIQHFNAECYLSLRLSLVDPNITFLNGEKLFVLDRDQRTEEERIRNIYTNR
jgi:hypothetical protein